MKVTRLNNSMPKSIEEAIKRQLGSSVRYYKLSGGHYIVTPVDKEDGSVYDLEIASLDSNLYSIVVAPCEDFGCQLNAVSCSVTELSKACKIMWELAKKFDK